MAFICNVNVHVNLWMVGFCRVPHSNQDTQTSIKSYHGILKWWLSFETKYLSPGCCIDWLVWRLTMIMAQHYMHQAEMKRWGFIKNKVVAWLVPTSVEKAFMIPHTNVIQPTLVGDDNVITWIVSIRKNCVRCNLSNAIKQYPMQLDYNKKMSNIIRLQLDRQVATDMIFS